MPTPQRPDGEIYHEEFGNDSLILLFVPGGLRSSLNKQNAGRSKCAIKARVTAFLDRHSPV